MNKKEIIKSFIYDLQNWFYESDELAVSIHHIANADVNGYEVYMNCICSYIKNDNNGEELSFDIAKEKFFYHGETIHGNVTGKTFFYLNRVLIDLLPIDLVEALKRVGHLRRPEIFIFPTNELKAKS